MYICHFISTEQHASTVSTLEARRTWEILDIVWNAMKVWQFTGREFWTHFRSTGAQGVKCILSIVQLHLSSAQAEDCFSVYALCSTNQILLLDIPLSYPPECISNQKIAGVCVELMHLSLCCLASCEIVCCLVPGWTVCYCHCCCRCCRPC